MKDIRQSPAWANYLKSIGWKIETCLPAGRKYPCYVYLKHFPILGWFAKLQRPEKLNSEIIDFIQKKYHPFQFSVEPNSNQQINQLTNQHFKLSNSPSLPTKTLIINLQTPEKDLLKSFSQKVRYNIKLSEKKNIKITESKNILDFTNFWRENFEKKRFFYLPAGMAIFSQQKNIIALHKAFGKNSKILLAKKDSKTIAVLFLLFYDRVAYYMYAASNDKGRNNFAPTLLTLQGILLSKKLGMKVFDFDGIYDERFPIKTWLGFTKFKYGFSKKEIKYPGMYQL